MGSETLPSACYILSDEPSIPFYSTSNGYNKIFNSCPLIKIIKGTKGIASTIFYGSYVMGGW